jgi:putative PIN family toxin of toxin-antitoxin system
VRVVIDTSVIVSAYLGGALEVILRSFKEEQFTLIVSRPIADEYFRVLQRPKLHVERDELEDFASLLVSKAQFVVPRRAVTAVAADPSDDKFLEAALEGEADCIVSGDEHLLALKAFRGIPILTARKFIERLKSKK